MKPRMLFNSSQHVIQTRTQRNWPWVLCAITVLIALYGWAGHIDQDDEARQVAQDELVISAYRAGRAQGHADMVDSARAAWQAAQMEADRCRRGP